MRSGLESTSGRNYGAWVRSANWVRHALRRPLVADPASAMEYSTGNIAPAVGDPDEGHRQEHVAVRAGSAGHAARLHARALAARSAGHLLRRQRDADDAAADGGVRRAVPERGRVTAAQVVPAAWVGRVVRAAHAARAGTPIATVRLRLVDPGDRRAPGLLRLGLRRPVHLRRSAIWISSSSPPRPPTVSDERRGSSASAVRADWEAFRHIRHTFVLPRHFRR